MCIRDRLEIGPETQVVGRNEACDLVLDDRKVSAVHMELVATERGVRVRDLGSRNGTFVGDTRIGEVYLTKAGFIVCGDTQLEFQPSNPKQGSGRDVAGFAPLAEQRIKSVGSNTYKPVNVRVIAATRRDLVREVNAGSFRSDLYFRVAQLKVEMPALRQRIED